MWQFKHFQDLSAMDFHQILTERTKIFVVEQGCAYQEVDDIDLRAMHVINKQKNSIKGYARIYKENNDIKIGRVLVPEEFRSEGHGKELLKVALGYVKCHHPHADISIQAEAYLKDFYESFGFEVTSDLYYDYDIGHYDMRLTQRELVLQG